MLKLEAEMARGETGNTEALLVRATELEPKFIEAHLRAGCVLRQLGTIRPEPSNDSDGCSLSIPITSAH